MQEFTELAKDTDKYLHHRFDIPYRFLFEHRRLEPLRVLEIGVKKGGSLRLWEGYFPKAEIFGIDIDPDCAKYATDRSKVYIGSQRDRNFLTNVITESGGNFDIVIDDGSHMPDDQVTALQVLWPQLRVGGIYVIEDVHAHLHYQSYKPKGHKFATVRTSLMRQIEQTWAEKGVTPKLPGIMCYGAFAAIHKHHAACEVNFLQRR